MKNEEILALVHLILDMGNCVLPVCEKQVEESPRETAAEAINYLQNQLTKEIGDEILAFKLVDWACFMNQEELLKEIEEVRKISR